MKKIISILLSGSMALTFCSCLLNNRKGSSSKPEENDIEGSSVESTDTSESGIRWCESTHFYLYGQEIIFGQTTVQELYATGCCCKFWEWDESYTNKLDRLVRFTISKLERIYLIVLSRQLLLFKKTDKAATLSDSLILHV